MPDAVLSGAPISIFTAQAACRFGEKIGLVFGERRWTYFEFDEIVDSLASGIALQMPRGERACVIMSNRPEFVFLQCALERAGIVRVPVNAKLTSSEVALIIDDCSATAVFYDTTTAERLEHIHQSEALWLCSVDRESPRRGPSFHKLMSSPAIPERLHLASSEDLCSINYTSGSSGRPKGVMLTHRNWMAVYMNMLIDRDILGTDIVAHVGPLSHASGTYLMPWFLRGATNVIINGGTADNLLRAIDELGITTFTCVPTFLTRLVNHPEFKNYDLQSLRAIGYGAEPIPRNTLEKAIDRFGPILTQNYGLTEAMMTCVSLTPEEHFSPEGTLRVGALGRPYSFVEIVIRDADGLPVPSGEVGEITIRSEHMMQGYWRMPGETAMVLRDGWLWSGDLATADESGFLTLCGRKKEMLISGGFNIYPQEIEAVLTNCPLVLEAAVIGIPDVDWGEAAVAFVSATRDAELSPAQIIDFCKPTLGIKTPKHVVILPNLPKNGNGKVDKKILRESINRELCCS